ncbi:MAG: FixH family protein [Acidobacteriota bacterium]|jgi:hypothetical protein
MRRHRTLLVLLLVLLPRMAAGGEAPRLEAATENGRLQGTLTLEDGDRVPLRRFHSWILRLRGEDGAPIRADRITVGGGMEGHGHGLPTAPEVSPADEAGLYRVEGVKFTMAGDWSLVFVVFEDGAREVLRFDIVVDY